MSAFNGSFTLPTPQRTGQLINDTRFSSIREYILNSDTLYGTTQLDISDLPSNSVIYRIDLLVLSAFSNTSGDQLDIEVSCDNGGVLMDSSWNDPNTIGTYVTDCYTTIRTSDDLVHVTHSLGDMLTGSGILRIYLYESIDETTHLLTSDGLYYYTADSNVVDVSI